MDAISLNQVSARGAIGQQSTSIATSVEPRRVLVGLLCLVALLTAASVAVHIFATAKPGPMGRAVVDMFNMNNERNVPAAFSTFCLLLAASLLWLLGSRYRANGRAAWHSVYALSVIFLYLAYDEAFSVHEWLGPFAKPWFVKTGPLYFTWVVFGLPFAILVGVGSIAFLRRVEPENRRVMVLAGATYVGSAVGLEMVGGMVAEQAEGPFLKDTWFIAVSTVEEAREMTGTSLFNFAVLRHIQRNFGSFPLAIKAP